MIDLPGDVGAVLSSLLSCEVATVGRDGTAAAWPMVPLWLPDRPGFVLTTSIGFAAKEAQLRRDPRIALCFSDPTGSGLTAPPIVLVQGTAEVSDAPLTTSPDLLAHWARVNAVQPVSRFFSSTPPARWFMDWYYMRAVLTVTPRRLLWWADRDTTAPPEVRERSDMPAGPAAREAGRAEGPTGLAGRLERFDSAVLTGCDAEGRPVAVRGYPRVDGGVVRWPGTPGTGLVAGPAALLCHDHDANLWNLRSFQARGRIDPDGDGWAFRAHRIVDGTGMSGPLGDLSAFVAARGRAGRYLARRGLDRPRVPFSVLRAAR